MKDETAIIQECQAGNTLAFAGLYDAYIKKIYNFIYYKTMHKETAEDLTSLTFTKAFTGIAGYDPARGKFSTWLYAIARNAVKDHYRDRRPEADLDDVYDLASDDDPEIDADNKLTLDQVKKYLDKLKPEHREAVMLRLWEGLPFQEIAEIMGVSVAVSKMTFYRTIAKLREELALIIFLIIHSFTNV